MSIFKCTAVLLSWKRLNQINDLSDYLQTFDFIDEILICNNNPDVAPFRKEGVTVINNSSDLGLWTRFTTAMLAKNEAILLHDDDLLVDHKCMSHMWESFAKIPTTNHGLFGRRFPAPDHTYNMRDYLGKCDALLTRCVFTSKTRCHKALGFTHAFDRELGGSPRGNGEDILLSYTGQNISYTPIRQEMGGGDDNAIHRRPGHKEHRTNVIRWCIKNVKPT